MKLAWIVPGFSGDESDWCIPALRNLARVLAARHELHVFALHYPYRRDRYSAFGACVHAIGGANRRGWRLTGTLHAAISQVAREQRGAPFDALHAFWLYEPGVVAAWLKQRFGLRVIVSVAGGELIDLPALSYGLGSRRWLMRAMRWAMQCADVVTTGSTGLLEKARGVAGVPNTKDDRFVLVPLGVDTEMFARPQSRRLSPPLRCGDLRETPPTIVNVGSLQAVKGQADLIRAFRLVVDREPKARLVIAGTGDRQAELEALVVELNLRDRVCFLGEVRHERMPDVYRQASLFVQASLHEAQGMAVLEAAACGLPIAGTAVGVLADLAPDAAVSVPPGDPARLADAIWSVSDDATRRRALAEAARARVEALYSLEAAAHHFERLYRG